MSVSRVLAPLFALGLSALMLGCPPAKPQAQPPAGGGGDKTGTGTETPPPVAPLPSAIHIGSVASLTGDNTAFGIASNNGFTLAVEQLNAQQYFGPGFQIVPATYDDQSTPTQAATGFKKLIDENKIVAVIGEVSSKISLAMTTIAEDNKIPMISPASTNETVTELPYVFRACYLDPFQGMIVGRYAARDLGKKAGAILYDTANPYSVGLKDAITAEFTAQGGQIVAAEAYTAGDKDYRSLIVKLKGSNPDVVFLTGYAPEAALIMNQAKSEGLAGPFLGGDGWDQPELLAKGGQAIEGSFFSTHYVETDTDPAVQSFVAAYNTKYGMLPDAIAALGYDATMMLAGAIKRAGTVEGPALQAAIASTKDFAGVTGKITLDEKGDPKKGIVIITITGGKRTLAARFDADGNPVNIAAAPVMADGTATTTPAGTTTTTTPDGGATTTTGGATSPAPAGGNG
ncbi:MAG: ABC transporter substrate-binding protein [bacterium]